jgi:hypothetical protein
MTTERKTIHRRNRWLAIEARIDDMNMTPKAFRVYLHLLALAHNGDEKFNIDMKQIGNHCFGSLGKRTAPATKKAKKAMHELRDAGLLSYENNTWTLI